MSKASTAFHQADARSTVDFCAISFEQNRYHFRAHMQLNIDAGSSDELADTVIRQWKKHLKEAIEEAKRGG